MNMTKKLIVSLVLALLVASFFGFSDSARAASGVWKFGVSDLLSGPAAPWGRGRVGAYKLAVETINQKGGFTVAGKQYKVELIVYDNKYNLAEAGSIHNRLIFRDKVKYLEIAGTSLVMATLPIAERNGVLSLVSAYGGNKVTNKENYLTFRILATADDAARATYPWMKKNWPEVKTVAFINPNDELGRETEGLLGTTCKSVGVKLVVSEFYERGTTDFSSIVTRILLKKPDMIDTGVSPPGDQALVVKEAAAQGFKGKFHFPTQPDPAIMVPVAGKNALEGALGANTLTEMITPELKEFRDRYVARFGEFEPIAANHYNDIFAVIEAISKAGTFDTRKVADTLADLEFDTLYGKADFGGETRYGIKRNIFRPIPLCQFKGGKLRTIAIVRPLKY
jgi:branched-chain amino acid transport system substrate-binding protein